MQIRDVDMNTAFSFSGDRKWIVIDPQGRIGTVSEYNYEVTGIPVCLMGVIGYSDNWNYWEDELRRRGWTVEEQHRND